MKPKKDKSQSKKEEPRKFGSFWKCLTCAEEPEFEHKDAMAHFKEVHGIDTKTAKGNKSMLMHMDGRDWFSWDYEWTIGDIKAVQHTVTERAADDMMRYG